MPYGITSQKILQSTKRRRAVGQYFCLCLLSPSGRYVELLIISVEHSLSIYILHLGNYILGTNASDQCGDDNYERLEGIACHDAAIALDLNEQHTYCNDAVGFEGCVANGLNIFYNQCDEGIIPDWTESGYKPVCVMKPLGKFSVLI